MSAPFPWAVETAESRLESALQAASGNPAAKAVFTGLLEDRARGQAKAAAGLKTPLSGALVSVKALFDVAGEITTSGTKVLRNDPPAQADAPAIARLDAAGGVFVGLTNMSEFAYSGLGLNPHHGTPQNPAYPGCAPGGSTSGGAVSVALGLCDVAIGSDTGGSLRIPAAFTGITGFKPTQASVPLTGGKPLSDSLDSFGPMAKSVAVCELAWQVMAGRPTVPSSPASARLVIPGNFGFDEIEPQVAEGFEAVVRHMQDKGFDVIRKDLDSMKLYGDVPPWHMTAVESRAHYEDHFQGSPECFDPRVHARMARAAEITAIDYRRTLNRRAEFIAAFREELGGDMLLLPTTPILPPKIDDLADDDTFNRMNLLALRNPTLANIADACSLALPYRHAGNVLSAMLIASGERDDALLACGKAVEEALAAMDRNN
ncbi:amidase family protein [Roseibium marinum]|uniref:Aspartyl-tRNA(Asn)/glutamyl-tRNA(Gln) amidotransferase subunit A n=1 Tax=Roseibium marinum TaxID=281252 RepID=A0A2S3UQ78_9HYPH|nr:amidase family protein [Roseibium marinum]POF29649.1 aspartyl-tRNA(Asn)/glutamyl-tRNA(Gln) amidotransferase subunit A [Roseibium marinum]